jgi:hypothetical protein
MNYEQFTTVIERMISDSIAHQRSERTTIYGKPIRTNGWPVHDVMVRLPPSYMLEVARNPRLVPLEMDGLPVRIAEAPSQVNKPSGRYMISVMCRRADPKTGRPFGGVGRVTLSEEKV